MTSILKLAILSIILCGSLCAQTNWGTHLDVYISSRDCQKCVYPIYNLFDKISSAGDTNLIKIFSDSKIILKKFENEGFKINIHYDPEIVNQVCKDGFSRVALTNNSKLEYQYKIKELNDSLEHKIFKDLNIITSNEIWTISSDRFESDKYYPTRASNKYFIAFEKLMPTLLIGSFNQNKSIFNYYTPNINASNFNAYADKIERNLNIKLWPYKDIVKTCRENHFDLYKLQSASLNEDTLYIVLDIGFFYSGPNGPIYRNMSFLESYLLNLQGDSIFSRQLNSDMIMPLTQGKGSYIIFYSEPFSIINHSPYCILRNRNEQKPFTHELIGAHLTFLNNQISYTDFIHSSQINVSDSLASLLKLHLYGNGAKLLKYENKYYLLYYYLNKMISIQEGKVYETADWIRQNINSSFDDKINFVKDISIKGDRIKILLLTKNERLVYLDSAVKNQIYTLLSSDKSSIYEINDNKILSFKINNEQVSVNAFPLD